MGNSALFLTFGAFIVFLVYLSIPNMKECLIQPAQSFSFKTMGGCSKLLDKIVEAAGLLAAGKTVFRTLKENKRSLFLLFELLIYLY